MRKNVTRAVALLMAAILIAGLVISGIGSMSAPAATTYSDLVSANAEHFMSAGLPEAQARNMAQVMEDEGVDAELTGIDVDDTGDFYILNLLFADIDLIYHMYVSYDGVMFQFGTGEVTLDDYQDHLAPDMSGDEA